MHVTAVSCHVQAELAQEEAQQLQGAGHFAEAAALSTTAHKWRKRAVKVHKMSNQKLFNFSQERYKNQKVKEKVN